MHAKKDIEKPQDSISPEISPGIPKFIARSQECSSIISHQEGEDIININVEKRS